MFPEEQIGRTKVTVALRWHKGDGIDGGDVVLWCWCILKRLVGGEVKKISRIPPYTCTIEE